MTALFEDREGSVWAATLDGLDRFRALAVVTYSAVQGLPNVEGSVLTASDGSIWVSNFDGRADGLGGSYGLPRALRPEPRNALLYARSLWKGCQTTRRFPFWRTMAGRIWIAGSSGIGHLESGRFVSIAGAPGGIVYGVAEDTARNIWVANLDHGLLQVSGDRVVRQIPWIGLGHKEPATALVADPLQGGLWLGFFHGGVAYWKDGQVRALRYGEPVAPPKAPSATRESARTERCGPPRREGSAG